jgi:desampylase
MRSAVDRAAPEEACGLLAGQVTPDSFVVEDVVPTTNLLHSQVRYRIDPVEQLQAFERMDAAGQVLVGIYHSHPGGPDYPSATDLAEAYYPDTVYLIWSGKSGAWECRAFSLQNNRAAHVELRVLP